MIVPEISAFDENYCIKDGIVVQKKALKYYNEIALIKCPKNKKKPIKISKIADEILYLEENSLNFMFVASMLFTNAPYDKIAEYMGVSVRAIELFEMFFFNVKKFRGVFGKINFFKQLLYHGNEKLRELGVILKSAHTFGYKYIEWKFALNTSQIAIDDVMKATFMDMYFKYVEKSFMLKPDEVENHIRSGKQLISAALDIQKASTQTSGGNTFDEIKNYLVKLNDEVIQKEQWNLQLDIIDVDVENAEVDEKNIEN